MKKVSALIALMLVAVLAFAACGGGSGDSAKDGALSGEYKLESAVVGGQSMTVDELKAAIEANESLASLSSLMDITFNFSGDKVTMNVMGQSVDTTYKLDGENITISEGADAISGTFKDGKLTLEQNGTTLVFAK